MGRPRAKQWFFASLLFLSSFRVVFLGGSFSGNINPPGGLPGTNPGFLETQISPKNQGLETGWSVFFEVFKVCGEKLQCCGINFSMRFQIE